MSIAEFEEISLIVCVGGLILFMLFILYKLAEESKAGKYGTFVIFFSLGLGFVGFAAKSVIKMFLES
ncbi:MAG: DUF2788 domain-containing protein [Gammaproteobacteria bacterium]|nr:DUF2788 domain-containing protein [Gammaproteobacteria bacterium]